MSEPGARPPRELLTDRWLAAMRSGRYMLYAGLTGAASVLGFLKGAAFARVLGDVGYGYYSLAILTTTYLMYPMSMGLKDGLLRNASILFGAGDEEGLRKVRDAVVSAIIAVGGVVAVIFSLVCWNVPAFDADTRLTLVLTGPLALFTVLFNVLLVDVQSRQRVVALGASLAGRQGLTLAIGLTAAMTYGFAGAIIGEGTALILLSAAVILFSSSRPRVVAVRPADVGEVFHIGLPLAGDALLRNVSVSIDKWFVSLFLGIQALGQYAFASIALAGALACNAILMQVLGPKWLGEYGRSNDLGKIHLEIRRIVILGAGAIAVGSVLLGAGGLRVLARIFPGYEAGLAVLPVIWIGVCVQIVNLFHWTAIAAGRGETLVRMSGIINGAIFAACTFGAVSGAELSYYAWVFSAGRVLSFLMNWALSRHIVIRGG